MKLSLPESAALLVGLLHALWIGWQVTVTTRPAPLPIRRAAARYFIGFALPFAALAMGLQVLWPKVQPETFMPSALQKVARYRQRALQYDLLFVGDSRTYCAMHPEQIDPLLGTRSVNLAFWAHWFPSQYPAAQDILEAAPAGTCIV